MTAALLDYAGIKECARFEQVLANYGLETTGRGAKKMTWCPFHDDSSPSCSINLEKSCSIALLAVKADRSWISWRRWSIARYTERPS